MIWSENLFETEPYNGRMRSGSVESRFERKKKYKEEQNMKRHNRHLLRSLCAVLMMVAMLLSLAACGGSSTFDASGYVSAYLKANLTGDTADLEGYSKEAVTQLEVDYDSEIESLLESMTAGSELSDEVNSDFVELIHSMLDNVSYTVGEATEVTEGSATGYTVPVTFKPLKLDVADELQEWATNLDQEDLDLTDMNALYDMVFKKAATLLKDAVAKGEYGEEETINLTVTKNEDGLYEPDQSQLYEIGSKLFTSDLTELGSLE